MKKDWTGEKMGRAYEQRRAYEEKLEDRIETMSAELGEMREIQSKPHNLL